MSSARFEKDVEDRLSSFDMPALLSLLAHHGYGDAELEYRSNRTTVHQGRLVHHIHFQHHPRKRVIITVNVGLLSAQSPLPSFLLRELEALDHERMERFLGYFDHVLLESLFAGLHPERNESLLPGWEGAAEERLSLLRPTCPSTLHWLFTQVYPETEISVRREVQRQAMPTSGVRLGTTRLGDPSALGGVAQIPTGALEVSIFCNEPWSGTGAPWASEALRRLEQSVLPRLAQTPLLLTVILILRDQKSYARLSRDSFLGYEPLFDSDAPSQRIPLFSGDTARHAAARQQPAALHPGRAA